MIYSKSKSAEPNATGKVMSNGTNLNVRRNFFMPYLGSRGIAKYVDTEIKDQAIYLSMKDRRTTAVGTDISKESAYNVGDVILSSDPKKMNRLGESITEKNGAYVLNTASAPIPIVLSGPTTNRPVENLYVGLQYFDTTLGKPIWVRYASGTWVDASGVTV